MNVITIKRIAKQQGVKTTKVPKSDLVRAIQHAEGNQPCFDTRLSGECNQDCCLWREDCH